MRQAVTLEGMFQDCCHDAPWRGNLGGWDTARVVNMRDLFRGSAVRFGSENDISGWNVSSLQTAEGMLADVVGFDQDLCGAWDGSWPSAAAVTDMLSGTACPEPQDPVPGVSFCHACAEEDETAASSTVDDGDDNAATVRPQQEEGGGNVAPPAPQPQDGDTHNVNNGGDGPLILNSRSAEESGAATTRASLLLWWTVSNSMRAAGVVSLASSYLPCPLFFAAVAPPPTRTLLSFHIRVVLISKNPYIYI